MNIPGFSAEASLNRTSGSYDLVLISGDRDRAGVQAVPSLIYSTWCGPCLRTGGQYCCSTAPRTGACWWSPCIPPPIPGGWFGGGGLSTGNGGGSGVTIT